MNDVYAIVARVLGGGEYRINLSVGGGYVTAISMLREEFNTGEKVGVIESRGSYFIYSTSRPVDSVLSIPQQSNGALFEENKAQAVAAYLGFLTNKVVELYEIVRAVSTSGDLVTVRRKGESITVPIRAGLGTGVTAADIAPGDSVVIGLTNLGSWELVGLTAGLEPFLTAIKGSYGDFDNDNPFDMLFNPAPLLALYDEDLNPITETVPVTVQAGFVDIFNTLGGGRGAFYPLFKSFTANSIDFEGDGSQVTPAAITLSQATELFYDAENDALVPFYAANQFRYTYEYGGKILRSIYDFNLTGATAFELDSGGEQIEDGISVQLSGVLDEENLESVNAGLDLLTTLRATTAVFTPGLEIINITVAKIVIDKDYDMAAANTAISLTYTGALSINHDSGAWSANVSFSYGGQIRYEGVLMDFSGTGSVSLSGVIQVSFPAAPKDVNEALSDNKHFLLKSTGSGSGSATYTISHPMLGFITATAPISLSGADFRVGIEALRYDSTITPTVIGDV